MNKIGSCLTALLIILAIVTVFFVSMSIVWGPDLVQQVKWENQQAQAKELAEQQARASMTKEEIAKAENDKVIGKMDNFSVILVLILSIMNFYMLVSNDLMLLKVYLFICLLLWFCYGWQLIALSFIVSILISLGFYSLVRSALK